MTEKSGFPLGFLSPIVEESFKNKLRQKLEDCFPELKRKPRAAKAYILAAAWQRKMETGKRKDCV